MVFVNLYGGIGNQLFQYSFARYIENNFFVKVFFVDDMNKKNRLLADFIKSDLYIVPRSHLQLEFGRFVSEPIVRRFAEKFSYFYSPQGFFYESNIATSLFLESVIHSHANIYLHGYWQDIRYSHAGFGNIDNTVNSVRAKYYARLIESSNSVAIHVRRGDYIKGPINKYKYQVLGNVYYSQAAEYVESNHSDLVFFIFSDDHSSLDLNFLGSRKCIEITGIGCDSDELKLMSMCKHNIVANSTFSWWAAYLNSNNSKCLVLPRKWYKQGLISPKLLIPGCKTL